MKLLSNITSKLFCKKHKIEISNSLKKVVDKYPDPAALMTYDSEWNSRVFLYANKRHQKLTGYSNDEIVGKTPDMFIGKNTLEKTINSAQEGLKNSSFWNGIITNIRKDGTETLVDLLIFAICYEGKNYFVVLKRSIRGT